MLFVAAVGSTAIVWGQSADFLAGKFGEQDGHGVILGE